MLGLIPVLVQRNTARASGRTFSPTSTNATGCPMISYRRTGTVMAGG